MNNTYFSSSSKTPTQSQAVEVSVSTDYLGDVLAFLLTKKISFEMTYNSMVTQTKPSESHDDFAKGIPKKTMNVHSLALSKTQQTVMETIYQKYICDNIEQIPPNESIIAEEYQLRASTFKRNFKAYFGKSFYQLYMQKKMEYAAEFLKQGYRCNDVSKQVGYGEKSAIKFNKMFQKHFGITPKAYQMEYYGSLNKRGR